MYLYRTLSLAAAMALGTMAAQAAPQNTYGETYPAAQTTRSTLTRAEVTAELVAARQAGTLPRAGDWSNVPAPLALAAHPRTREDVRKEAMATAKAGSTAVDEEKSVQ